MTAVDARARVLPRLELTGGGYVTQDGVTARCPVCHGGMAVAFIGRSRFSMTCCSAGCRESLIVAELFGLQEVDQRDEELADLRAQVHRLVYWIDFLRDLAFEPCPLCCDHGQVVA